MKISYRKVLSSVFLCTLLGSCLNAVAQEPQTPTKQTQVPTTSPTNNPANPILDQMQQKADQTRQDLQQQQDNTNDRLNETDQSKDNNKDDQQQDKKGDKDKKDDQEKEKKTDDENSEVEKDLKNSSGVKAKPPLPIFGNEIFNNPASTFAPNNNRPTPVGYILGPGDELEIDVTGLSVTTFKTTVTPEGTISLREFGKLYVGGKTIENATESIKAKLRANNFAVGNGTHVDVILMNIRSIRVTMLGNVRRPGDYNLSSISTAFNALYESGGITDIGTFRGIQVIRNNEQIAQIDMYDYLLRGDKRSDITLKDGDVIMVPEYRVRVSVEGEVKRQAYFEVLPGENLSDVIKIFAGGFTDYAYKYNIKAVQLTDKEQRLKDINPNEMETYVPLKGDKYMVSRILDRYENRVTIAGSVYRPGDYELSDGLTLKELVAKADGLKEDAYTGRGYITRLNEDNSSEVVAFDLKGIMDGSEADIPLKREDVIQIFSIFDYADAYTVSINGSVRDGGTYPFFNGMTVEDLILQAKGFADGANKFKVQVARRVKDSDRMSRDAKLANLIEVTIDPELKLSTSKFKLEPFDVVSVFSLPGFVSMQVVTVSGEVMNPGGYAMLKRDERISDILKRTGGFTAYANLKDATFSRGGRVGNINIDEIIKHPGGKKDIILLDGDVISIPSQNQLVKVSGEVLMPMSLVYGSSSLSDYVYNSGGFTDNAFKRKAYVKYANGSVKGTKPFLFFKNYPTVEPGSEIVIPAKPPRKAVNGAALAQTWIGLSASLASVAAIIFAIVNSKN